MQQFARAVLVTAVLTSGQFVWAHSEHEHEAGADHDTVAENTGKEQALSGEVVDVACYLTHGNEALGKGHADCATKCIKSGLPVAIRVGDQLYLAVMADHVPANQRLASLAGQHVTVYGKVMERDGQHLIAVSRVEQSQ